MPELPLTVCYDRGMGVNHLIIATYGAKERQSPLHFLSTSSGYFAHSYGPYIPVTRYIS